MSDPIPSEKQDNDLFVSYCLRGANEIRGLLHLDDSNYTKIFFRAHQNARNYYTYGVLDEIEKSGVALMGYKDILQDTSGDSHDRISRNVFGSIVDQQMVWVRKLTEILAELILFTKTNTQEHYKHYLHVHHLVELKRTIEDTKEYFACENLNHRHQLDEIIKDIQLLETNIDLSSCWYLRLRKGGSKYSGISGKTLPFKDKIKLAYMQATKEQKLALGTTYNNAYGHTSQSLHPNLVQSDPDISSKDIETGIAQIGLLVMHILALCKKLLGDKRKKGLIAQLARAFRTNKYPQKVFKTRVNPTIKKGDFVIAYGDVSQVIKINKSIYGYRSFTVRYLGKPPIPDIPVDSFPAMFIRKFFARKVIADQVRLKIKENTPDLKVNNKTVSDALRKTALDMWEKFGFKEKYYGRPDLARKKIEDYLNEQKSKKSF